MSTLEELAFYCRKKEPMGALALLGESGCGKTFLIKNELKELLKDTHVIVHESLFGIGGLDELHSAVKKNWVHALMPVLTKKKSETKGQDFRESFFKAAASILQIIDPRVGNLADAASDPLKYIVVVPEVEDIHTKTKKEVVLVFDDVDRTSMNLGDLLGAVNDYCENQHFHMIIVAGRDIVSDTEEEMAVFIRKAREKVVAYAVYNYLDYKEIVHRVVEGRNWRSEEYASYLRAHEQTILELFSSDDADVGSFRDVTAKNHNIRSLITGLESFHRIYYHLSKANVLDIEPYLCAFLPAYLCAKGGINKNGITTYTISDEEIAVLYPRYSAENLFESVRLWINQGYWSEALFEEELSHCC